MSRIAYTVTATFPNPSVRDAYVSWLVGEHVAAVVAAGALSGEVVVVHDPGDPIQVEARYVFANQASLDGYLKAHAPALRAQGLALFGPGTGVQFARRTGAVLTPGEAGLA